MNTSPHALLGSRLQPLGNGRHVVIDDFMSREDLGYWRSLAALKQQSGALRPAAIGHGNGRIVASAIRNDRIAWIELDPHQSTEARLAQQLEGLRLALNEQFLLGLFDLELHLASYPPGGFYAAHVDRFRDDHHRIISMIIYLSDAWSVDDGGALRIWSGTHERPGEYVDIPPIGGRLVLFMSGATLHEVTVTRGERTALTGWFRCRT